MEHKLAVTSGPAAIVFTSKLYDKCHIFIQKRKRNMLVRVIRSGQSCVFLSWNSNTMSSALIGDQFSAFLEKATSCTAIWKERRKRKMTMTLVRKSFNSEGHSKKKNSNIQLIKDLSNMMCHSENTARGSYLLEEKKKNVHKTFEGSTTDNAK